MFVYESKKPKMVYFMAFTNMHKRSWLLCANFRVCTNFTNVKVST